MPRSCTALSPLAQLRQDQVRFHQAFREPAMRARDLSLGIDDRARDTSFCSQVMKRVATDLMRFGDAEHLVDEQLEQSIKGMESDRARLAATKCGV